MTAAPIFRRLAALLATAALLAGCSGGGDDDATSNGDPSITTTEASPTSGGTDESEASPTSDGTETTDDSEPASGEATEAVELEADEDLYAVPDPIPDGEHGTLLRYQEITPSIIDGARTWRVMYSSESLAGDPIVVTGTILVPTAPAPAEGRTVLAVAHGTTGIADECAPSKGDNGSLALFGPAIEKGWIVTATDYEGLGTPGRHPYLVGESEGRSVIDSVRAAGDLPDAEPSDQVAIAGYSQGGHGALFAGEVAAEWAPELEVAGTFAGAPATEIDIILRAAPSLGQAGFAYMIVAGIEAAYPDADAGLFLTDEGVDRLDAVDEGCTSAIFAAVAGVPAADLVRPEGADTEPWKTLAVENNPGRVVTEAPILIVHSETDDVVPVALSGILYARMCDEGQVVERRVLPNGGGHGAAAPEAFRQGLEWLEGQLTGAEPVDGCATQD